jgi:hypothetical protein
MFANNMATNSLSAACRAGDHRSQQSGDSIYGCERKSRGYGMQRRKLKAIIDIIHFSRRAGKAGQNGADTPFFEGLFLDTSLHAVADARGHLRRMLSRVVGMGLRL